MSKRSIKNKQQNICIINLKKAGKELPKFHRIRTHSPSKLAINAGDYFIICANKVLSSKSKNGEENKND